MKVVLIIIGSLAALYAAAAVVQFIKVLMTANPGTAYGGSYIAAGVVPICLGLIVAAVCFQRAFRKPKP